LKNGREVDGVVIDRRNGRVSIRTKTGEFSVAESDVTTVRTDGIGAAKSRIEVLLSSEKISEIWPQLEPLWHEHRLGRIHPDTVATLTLLAEHVDRIATYLERAPRDAASATIAFLSEPDTWDGEGAIELPGDYRVALARWYWRLGRQEDALALLKQMALDSGHLPPESAKRLVTPLVRLAWRAQRQHDAELAGAALQLLERIHPPTGRAARAMALLQDGQRALNQGEFRRALEIFHDRLAHLAPVLARLRTDDALLQAETKLKSEGAWDLLIELQEKFGPNVKEDDTARGTMERTLQEAGKAALSTGQPNRAVGYFNKLAMMNVGKPESWIRAADLAKRRSELDPDDSFAHFEFGIYCLSLDELDLAETAFEVALRHPELAPNARKRIDLIHETRALRLMDRATEALSAGRVQDALDRVMEFQTLYPDSPMQGKVIEIAESARKQIKDASDRRPLEAEALFQQAERLLFLQKPSEALLLLDKVIMEFGDTPAAKRARNSKRIALDKIYSRIVPGLAAPDHMKVPSPLPPELVGLQDRVAWDTETSPALHDEVQSILATLAPHLGIDDLTEPLD